MKYVMAVVWLIIALTALMMIFCYWFDPKASKDSIGWAFVLLMIAIATLTGLLEED